MVKDSVTSALKQVGDNLCRIGETIECDWFAPCKSNPCQNNGTCVIDDTQKATCKCSDDDVYTYSGAKCELKAKKLISEINYTIAIVIGGLSAVLLITVVICCVCISKRRDNKTRYDNENIHEHGTLSYNHPMGLLGRQRVPSNLYLTQTSRDDDNYFIDYRSRHTYMEGNMNSNDLSNETASDLPDEIDYVPEFCNNAIFEKEFNIKRPQIRSESIPVFNNFGRPTAYRPDYI